MEFIKKLGQFVRERRLQKGISQTKLSELIFNSPNQSYISQLEGGLLDGLSVNTVEKILEALDADIEFKGLD